MDDQPLERLAWQRDLQHKARKWLASSAYMGAGRAQQGQLPDEGSGQGTLILPAGVRGKGQMGVEGMGGRMSEVPGA